MKFAEPLHSEPTRDSIPRKFPCSGTLSPVICFLRRANPRDSPSLILNVHCSPWPVKQSQELALQIGLAVLALLFLAVSVQAQHPHSRCARSVGGIGLNWSVGGELVGATISSGEPALQYAPPRVFAVSYATNDGDFVPSTFMNYDEALALGKQRIVAAARQKNDVHSVSLGEVARAYRASKDSKLQASLVQGDSHNLEVCDMKSSTCRRL